MRYYLGPMVEPADLDGPIPESADVVVIGGGIAGVSTTLFLAQRGVNVVLCEKGYIGAEQSSRNWGWVTARNRDMRELPICLESGKLWRGMNALIGLDTGYRRTGSLRPYTTAAALAQGEDWLKDAKRLDFPARILSNKEIRDFLPDLQGEYLGAVYAENDGRAEPQKAAPAIASGARKFGAKIFTQCAVRGIETAGGQVSGVVTEQGRIRCTTVVLAGGAWSTLFLRRLGVKLPQLLVQASAMRTVPFAAEVPTTSYFDRFSLRKRLDGGFTIGDPFTTTTEVTPDAFRFAFDYLPMLQLTWKRLKPRFGRRALREWLRPAQWALDEVSPFEAMRVLDPVPTQAFLASAHRALVAALPMFKDVPIAQKWAGLLDITPDAVPVISAVETPSKTIPGMFTICGFSGHGFGMGPGAGHLMADLVTGAAPIVDPSPFRLARFSDGSRPRPKAGF